MSPFAPFLRNFSWGDARSESRGAARQSCEGSESWNFRLGNITPLYTGPKGVRFVPIFGKWADFSENKFLGMGRRRRGAVTRVRGAGNRLAICRGRGIPV